MNALQLLINLGWNHEPPTGKQLELAEKELSHLAEIVRAVNGLVEYRKRNTLNFQLEKADDFIRIMRNELEGLQGKQ